MWGQFAASEKGGGVVCQDQFSVLFFLFLPGDKSIFVLLEANLKLKSVSCWPGGNNLCQSEVRIFFFFRFFFFFIN